MSDIKVSSEPAKQQPADAEKKKKNLLKKLRAIDDLQAKVFKEFHVISLRKLYTQPNEFIPAHNLALTISLKDSSTVLKHIFYEYHPLITVWSSGRGWVGCTRQGTDRETGPKRRN